MIKRISPIFLLKEIVCALEDFYSTIISNFIYIQKILKSIKVEHLVRKKGKSCDRSSGGKREREREKLGGTNPINLKYGSFKWGRYPKGAPLGG